MKFFSNFNSIVYILVLCGISFTVYNFLDLEVDHGPGKVILIILLILSVFVGSMNYVYRKNN